MKREDNQLSKARAEQPAKQANERGSLALFSGSSSGEDHPPIISVSLEWPRLIMGQFWPIIPILECTFGLVLCLYEKGAGYWQFFIPLPMQTDWLWNVFYPIQVVTRVLKRERTRSVIPKMWAMAAQGAVETSQGGGRILMKNLPPSTVPYIALEP